MPYETIFFSHHKAPGHSSSPRFMSPYRSAYLLLWPSITLTLDHTNTSTLPLETSGTAIAKSCTLFSKCYPHHAQTQVRTTIFLLHPLPHWAESWMKCILLRRFQTTATPSPWKYPAVFLVAGIDSPSFILSQLLEDLSFWIAVCLFIISPVLIHGDSHI